MAEVKASKSSERAVQESIEKVVETFDGVQNLSAEQSDSVCNFMLCMDLLAMLPTGFGTFVVPAYSWTLSSLRVSTRTRCCQHS